MTQYSMSRLMKEDEVAEYFGVSVKTLRRWRDEKLIDCMRPPGDTRMTRYHRRQVEDFVQKMACRSDSPAPKAKAEASLHTAAATDDEISAFQRAYEISQHADSNSSSKREKTGRAR